jgi:hypothetical protein
MDVRLETRGHYLLAMFAGVLTFREVIAALQKACDAARDAGVDLLVADCFSLRGNLTTFERYEMGRTMAEYCRERTPRLKAAVIGRPPVVTGFGSLVASNRGLRVRSFSDLQSGLEWLEEEAVAG